jgi:hypothetical protein
VTVIIQSLAGFVIASQRVGAKRRPMTGSANQSIVPRKEGMDCFVATRLAMTGRYGDAGGVEQRW